MGDPVVHFEVVGKDAEALQSFYGEVFGWEMKSAMPTYAMAMPGGQGTINGGVGASMDGGSGHVTFYVEVPDLEKALGTIQGRGGTQVMAPMDVPGGPRIAMFSDPEGHLVGLTQAGSGRGSEASP